MYVVALTGAIASGKSTLLQKFASLGVATASADIIARQLTQPQAPAYQAIIDHFGVGICDAYGQLNRSKLRQVISDNPQEKQWLENCLHPQIRAQLQAFCLDSTAPYCMIEIPLLTTKADYPYLNHILWVDCAPEVRLQRLMLRDHCNAIQAQKMLDLAVPAAQFAALADRRVDSEPLSEQGVLDLHQEFLARAQQQLT